MSHAKGPEPELRRATPSDLPDLVLLEAACFELPRRASTASLARSLTSDHQSVWVLDGPPLAGLLVLWHHARSLRVYDVAVHPDHRGRGLARRLMEHAETVARNARAERVILEADPAIPGLVALYEHLGYRTERTLADYYAPGRAAVRMEKKMQPA